ncbi:MAG: shikimate dehydrogenase [Campylobacterales bacterium]|nr:shikimate dehydrogenase [Campylobacterales bacterium]
MNYFSIFGNPINHSKSPQMHNMAFKKFGYKGVYSRYLLNDGSLFREKFLNFGLSGANITVPFKEDAFNQCDEVIGIAKKLEAVNTVTEKNGKLIGYNTDAPGFFEMIKSRDDIQNIAIVGAGGTAKAISIYLRDLGYNICIINRSLNRKEYYIKNNIPFFTLDDINIFDFDLIINSTSAGLIDNLLPINIDLLKKISRNSKIFIDVIYGKQTPFLQFAKENSIDYKDGFEMLLNQGVIAFDYFTNHQFDLKDIKRYMAYGLTL